MIGYKMWGALLARALNAAGIVVVIPDMRNYPWASVPSMVNDTDKSLAWTLDNISRYGGDPDKVVVGQSAGGHVACTALLRRANRLLLSEEEKSDTESCASTGSTEYDSLFSDWSPTDIKGFIFLSAPLSLDAMEHTFGRYGFDKHLVDRMFGGDPKNYDPHRILSSLQQNGHQSTLNLPPIRIYHGSLDQTVPTVCSETFYAMLQNVVVDRTQISYTCYEGWSHTDAIQEWADDSPNLIWLEDDPRNKHRLCPHFLVCA